ncbi:hypothetical protein [Flavisolibacter tropicus]|uniref:Uncharacterized protein n=1 Tax=Flavisolibacter tropicus TaxID=1492898 RepID=A0A172TXJ9_9BACT|nr:hypothetical protein [Flavisolibacter tropicus]ANE51604.1 hypothetical protein SY85_14950 [Flavisolibacter tropicus]
MRLAEFILLSEGEKKVVVLHQGILIAKRTRYPYMVFLFQMDNYYAEAFCNIQTKAIEEYRAFNHPSLLKPYLEEIAIDDLLE